MTKLTFPAAETNSDPSRTSSTDLQVVVDNNTIGADTTQSFNYHFSREGSEK